METVVVPFGGARFYCEIRGKGPAILLVPSGEGDCGGFDRVATELSDSFTVVTLDMRGCSRSLDSKSSDPISARQLGQDLAAVIGYLELSRVSAYGSSSGGQACLSLGVDHPHLVRNLVIHEAALLAYSPQSCSGHTNEITDYFIAQVNALSAKLGPEDAFETLQRGLIGEAAIANFEACGPDYIERFRNNATCWMQRYLPHAVTRKYTDEELANLPPTSITVSMLSPAWISQMNANLAHQAGLEIEWLSPPNSHFPQFSSPDWLVEKIRSEATRNLVN